MTHTVSSTGGTSSRPRLCRSDHQPNMLEYIDTTLNDSFASRLKVQSSSSSSPTTSGATIVNGSDQFGNTIVDQYLLYILCQKLHPNRTDHRAEHHYQSLHQLLVSHGKISKSVFEYSPPTSNRNSYSSLFHHYTNFIWNEFDVEIMLELACFLLKYRLRDLFSTASTATTSSQRQKITGYFLEIIAIYYLSSSHQDFFVHSRSTDMLFPYPTSTSSNSADSPSSTFTKFLDQLNENGEIVFDLRQVKMLLQSDAYQFVNKKLENKKIGFLNFFDTHRRALNSRSCRSLKSLCRYTIKMHVKRYPQDIEQFALFPSITDRLLTFLTHENKYAFESYV